MSLRLYRRVIDEGTHLFYLLRQLLLKLVAGFKDLICNRTLICFQPVLDRSRSFHKVIINFFNPLFQFTSQLDCIV